MLSRSTRSGFTLVEIMIAAAAWLVISAAVYQVLLTTIRLSRAQAAQFGVQSNTRGALLAVTAELRELSSADLLSVALSAITYRAMRGTGFMCQSAAPDRIQIRRSDFSGHREPQANRDSILVYIDAAQPETTPSWIPAGITKVTPVSCPGGVDSGFELSVPPTASLAGAPPGTPVRIYEIMELKQYRSDGKTWLGLRSVSAGEAIQPLFGPLHQTNGFQLQYLDAQGTPTSNPSAITAAVVTVQAIGDEALKHDLTTGVTLRNAQP